MSSSSDALGRPRQVLAEGLPAGGMKALILAHRYVGVALGLLMTLWCLSGFVMLYASFPGLTPAERAKGLEPLRLTGCCDLSRLGIDPEAGVDDLRVEMLLGRPVLHARVNGRPRSFDLTTGEPVAELTPEEVREVARSHGRRAGIAGPPGVPELIETDQWSVALAERNQPLYRVRYADAAASDLYVSGASGLVVLDTNRTERILGWLGPVPHWLYPTLLRRNGPVWTQVVIWTSVAGLFLTVMGLWIGVVRFRPRPNGRWSAYRGLLWQHHVPGLIFGLLTLTWVFSGLMTMEPWGTLSDNSGQIRREFVGRATWAEARRLLADAPALARQGVVQLEAAPLGGKLFVLARTPTGERRLDATGQPAPVTAPELMAAAAAIGVPVRELTLLRAEDDYYYGQGRLAALPVHRLILGDAGQTRLYIDPQTGRVLRAAGPQDRARRWLETGLHDFDFASIRRRPVWDLVVIPLLAGVTFLCATGFWLGLRRMGRDFGTARALLRKRRRNQD